MGLVLSACAPDSSPVEVEEDTSADRDELRALRGSCVDSCGGKSQSKRGNCWCDEECSEYGDCCTDYEDVCGEPPVELCLTDAACGAGSYCDHTECLSNCPDGMVCPAVCYGQCVESPVTNPQCGGFAGLPCPDGLECVDNPGDSCDPKNGGADCGGICIVPVGEACGSNTCGAGEFCCNPSCGICAPEGWACTQQVCDSLE